MRDLPGSQADVYETRDAACPFVAVHNDAQTRFDYPSLGNFCYGLRPPKAVPLDRQSELCLNHNYCSCSIYRDACSGKSPEDCLAGAASSRQLPVRGRARRLFAALVTAGMLAGIFLLYPGLPALWNQPTPTLAPGASVGVEETSTAAALAQLATHTLALPTNQPEPTDTQNPPTPTLTASPQPKTPTATRIRPTATLPPPTPGPGLETPFGPGQVYLLHKVQAGESLTQLAIRYNSSLEVIQAANVFKPGIALWPGRILVILPGQKDPAGVPRFQVVFLEQETLVDDLLADYVITPEDLWLYNSLDQGESIPGGRWLIILAED